MYPAAPPHRPWSRTPGLVGRPGVLPHRPSRPAARESAMDHPPYAPLRLPVHGWAQGPEAKPVVGEPSRPLKCSSEAKPAGARFQRLNAARRDRKLPRSALAPRNCRGRFPGLMVLIGPLPLSMRDLCPILLLARGVLFPSRHGPYDCHRGQRTSRTDGIARSAGQQRR